MLRRISLGTLGLWVGALLTTGGFAAYFMDNATLNLVGFFYGIPVLLGGIALKVTELKPVPYTQPPAPEAVALRNQKATATQNQVRKDITRYRYGQAVHLDTSLKHLGLDPSDIECPTLRGLREVEYADTYALILEFESPAVPLETWQQKQEKMEAFFGPNVRVEVTQPDEDRIDLALIAM